MDYETKLVRARLDAIEAVLLNLIGKDSDTLERLRAMLSQEHEIAHRKQHAPNKGGFQTAVLSEMPPPRDTGREQAQTEAFERLCRKFGAPFLK